MEKGQQLPLLAKRYIVQQLACYEAPASIIKGVKAEFGLDITRQTVHYYVGLADHGDLKLLFDATRAKFLADIDIPIANKVVRLRHLQRQVDHFADKNAAGIILQLLEAAAKEVGGAFTNEHKLKHSGPNGEPLPAAERTVIILPDNGRGDLGRPNSDRPATGPTSGVSGKSG